jgi:2-amino-4-hydroxy-6-hydroxymethyldihydropteridine diphosphokinase
LALTGLPPEITVLKGSSVYETAPMYVTDQGPFLNAAVLARTELGPLALLAFLKAIEANEGRVVRERYGPREIDLDLVGYGSLAYRFAIGDEVRLQVPHPRTVERRFVLRPLFDIAPHFHLPGLGRVDELLGQTEDQARSVVRIEDALLPI